MPKSTLVVWRREEEEKQARLSLFLVCSASNSKQQDRQSRRRRQKWRATSVRQGQEALSQPQNKAVPCPDPDPVPVLALFRYSRYLTLPGPTNATDCTAPSLPLRLGTLFIPIHPQPEWKEARHPPCCCYGTSLLALYITVGKYLGRYLPALPLGKRCGR